MSDKPRGANRRDPCWNIVSVLLACLTVLIAVGASTQKPERGWGWQIAVMILLPTFCILVLGLVAAAVALWRSERYPGLTAAGFALNGLLLLYPFVIAAMR
jgi:hypothetical protein